MWNIQIISDDGAVLFQNFTRKPDRYVVNYDEAVKAVGRWKTVLGDTLLKLAVRKDGRIVESRHF